MTLSNYELYAQKLRTFKKNDAVPAADLVSAFQSIVEEFDQFKRAKGRQTYDALMASDQAKKQDILNFITNFTAADTDHPFLRRCKKLDKMRHAASLKVSFAQRTRRMMNSGRVSCPEFMVQEKKYGYFLAEILGARCPQRTETPVHFTKLAFEPGTALKPPSGSASNGVYLIKSADEIIDVRQSKQIKDTDELLELLREDVEHHRVPGDEWHVEELVRDTRNPGNMSHDWKFYCFYGEIRRIGRIERFPEHRETWVDGDFAPAKGVRKGLVPGEPIIESQMPAGLLALATKMSKRLPAPFVRIDFLSCDSGSVFGEFTARPGTFHLLDKETDRLLGDAFIRAEARLSKDLLAGRKFEEYELFFEHRTDPAALFRSTKWLKRRVRLRAKRELSRFLKKTKRGS